MLTTCCPKCEKEVTVPAGAQAESRVRCPICSEEYTLEGVFAELPPLLELLDAPSTNGAAAAMATEDHTPGMFDFGGQGGGETKTDADGDIALADADDVAPASSGFDFGDAAAPAASSVAGGISTSVARPSKKKSSSPMKMILGVVFGGLIAAPVAQLILWWLPGSWNIEQQDPMRLARDYPSSLGLLAPAHIRNFNEDETAAPNGKDPEHAGAKNPPDDQPLANLDNTPNSFGRDDLNDALKGNKPPDDKLDPGDKPAPSGGDPIDSPPVIGEPPDFDDLFTGDKDDEKPAGLKKAPRYSTKQLSQEIQATKDALPLLDEATDSVLSGPERIAKATEFVEIASKLAEVTTYAEKRPVGHQEHLDEMLAEVGESHAKRRFLGALARRRLEDEQRDGDGLILAAVVKEIRQQGQLFETVMEIDTTDNPPVSIYGPRDPSGAFEPGDMVILLGVIIPNPKKTIRGYQGPPDPVIWGGYSQVVAK